MPGLPRISLEEAEATGVGRQPAVRRFGPEVQLGRAAMQRGARRGDPFRVGMGGEQFGLFGVGAEAGDDDQGDAVAGRGGRHLVERGRDVRPHPLAVAVDERAAVAAAARDRRAFAAGARHRRRRFGFGARFDFLRRAGAEVELADHDRLRPHRGERGAVGEGETEAARVDFVAPPGGERGFARPVQVGRLRDVTRIGRPVGQARRREQLGEVVAHRADRRDRGQVGGALRATLAGHRPGDRDQRARRRDQDEAAAEREDQRLARLGADRGSAERSPTGPSGADRTGATPIRSTRSGGRDGRFRTFSPPPP